MSSGHARLSPLPVPSTRTGMNRWATRCGSLVVALALMGCAAQIAFRDGKALIAQGKPEEGLSKLQEAVREAPGAVEYRVAYLSARERVISSYLEQGDRLFRAGNLPEAEKSYQRVLALDAVNERGRAGLRSIETEQRHTRLLAEARTAWDKKDIDTAQFKLRSILSENPHYGLALKLRKTIIDATMQPPADAALAPGYKKPITIEFKDVAIKQVFEVISRTSGLNFLFDKDVKTDQKTSIFLKNSNVASVVHYVLLTNQLEQQILDPNTVLIYPNTAAKQKDYQDLVVRTFLLANADAKSVANALKTIVKSKDVVVDERLNMLIVRDSPAAIRLAERLIAVQDVPEPEVMLEVEILEVKRSRIQELGIKWPSSLSLAPLPSTTGGALTLQDLQNTSSSTIGAAIGPVTINARQLDSDANILANPRIRARNREKAKILIGERVPNITSTSTATGFVSESVNYVDVGLKLDVEPTVYLDNDVAIKISLEVSNIVSQIQTKSGSIAYQIGTRTASTVLRLKDGENQVLAGLINDEDRRSADKVPGVGNLPLVGRLFGSTADNNQKTEIVLSITPRLIRNLQRPDDNLSEFRSGTDSTLRLRPDHTLSDFRSGADSGQRLGPNGGVVLSPAAAAGSSPARADERQAATAGTSLDNNAAPAPNSGTLPLPSSSPGAPGMPISTPAMTWLGPATTRVGEVFSMQLLMSSDQPITGLPMTISYDNQTFQPTAVSEGDFLKQGGAATDFASRVEPSGQILITATRAGAGGATASGVVASINFRALKNADSARIQLLTVAPVGLAGQSLSAQLPMPHSVKIAP